MENVNTNTPMPPQTNGGKSNDVSTKNIVKIIVITVLAFFLLIPTLFIRFSVEERQNTAREAAKEVFTQWAESQEISGPYIQIRKTFKEEKQTNTRDINILPNDLKISGNVKSQQLNRGIYEIVTYNGDIQIEGNFLLTDEEFDLVRDFKDGQASINISVTDLKGLSEEVIISLGDKKHILTPNGSGFHYNYKKISGTINLENLTTNEAIPFTMSLSLKGSQSLKFVPVAKNTCVSLQSNCKTPSFNGMFLPEKRNVSDSGFTCNWKVLYINRNYPQIFESGEDFDIAESNFGVDFLLPVQHYQKTERSLKYAILFIALTFATFFFIEVLQKKNVNFIQYILVGLALVLFYSLLLSFSEHVGFGWAYLISAFMTITMLTVYTAAILKIRKTALCICGVLTGLYTYIYVLLQMETYALLAGSIGLFVILGVAMYVSQKINWKAGKE